MLWELPCSDRRQLRQYQPCENRARLAHADELSPPLPKRKSENAPGSAIAASRWNFLVVFTQQVAARGVTFRAMAILRRGAIMMAGFLLLHLTVASALAGCDMKSDVNQAGPISQSMAGMTAAEMPRPSDESAPHQSPSVPDLCSASVPCALAVVPSDGMRYFNAGLSSTEHSRSVASSPASRSVAPEPPPPRA